MKAERLVVQSQKQALRAQLLPLRQQALARGPDVTARIAAGVRAWLEAHAVRCVGFYWPLAGEPDLRATIGEWLAQDARRRAALPLVVRAATPLRFAAWASDTPMREGKYGITVPDHPADAAATTDVLPDAFLIPCVGFDRRGFRLGYGGGFYDRTLASRADGKLPDESDLAPQRVRTLGIALEATRIDALPTDAFDIPMDAIQTECRLYLPGQDSGAPAAPPRK